MSNGQLSGFTGKDPSGTNFKFFSSFQSNLLVDGLRNQIGWGHIWNRFAGPLSCRHQPHQCALTPLLPPAWWDGEWQSPIPRDIQRLKSYGVTLTENGDVVESHLQAFCRSREDRVKTLKIISQWEFRCLWRPNCCQHACGLATGTIYHPQRGYVPGAWMLAAWCIKGHFAEAVTRFNSYATSLVNCHYPFNS